MTVVNEKNVIIDGFHLFLLVCIIRDSTACQNGILIYCSFFISILLFYLYIKYDGIRRKFKNFFIQKNNNCNFSCFCVVRTMFWFTAPLYLFLRL